MEGNTKTSDLTTANFIENLKKHLNKFEFLVFSKKNLDEKEMEKCMINTIYGVFKSLYLLPDYDVPTKILLPKKDKNKKKTLFLDIDETLLHLSLEKPNDKLHSVTMRKKFETTEKKCYLVFRPFAKYLLEHVSKKYEIFIFTSATSSYAEIVANKLDPKRIYIDGILHRDQCLYLSSGKIKDLRRISNRNIEEMVLIDNLSTSFGKLIENGIPVLNFIDNYQDEELLYLTRFLLKIADVEDIREEIKKQYNFKKIFSELFK